MEYCLLEGAKLTWATLIALLCTFCYKSGFTRALASGLKILGWDFGFIYMAFLALESRALARDFFVSFWTISGFYIFELLVVYDMSVFLSSLFSW